jgi:hypothetical protein
VSVWSAVNDWEETYSRDWEPWDEDSERRARATEAAKLVDTDASEALARFVALADEGSTFAMRWVGTLYQGRQGVATNEELAEEYYRRGLCAGSWLASLRYASLLYRRGAYDECRETLADGVRNGFIPAFFWQGWYTYRLHPGRKVAEEVRPLMLEAAEAGHPGAKLMLARWTARGRYGWRQVPEGLRMLWAIVVDRTAASPSSA